MAAQYFPIQLFLEAMTRLETRMLETSADNLKFNSLRLMLFTDGSCRLEFDWVNDIAGRSKEEILIDNVFGAGETNIGFKNLDELKRWFIQRKVWVQ